MPGAKNMLIVMITGFLRSCSLGEMVAVD